MIWIAFRVIKQLFNGMHLSNAYVMESIESVYLIDSGRPIMSVIAGLHQKPWCAGA